MNLRFDSQKQMVMKRFLFIVMVVFIGFGSHQLLRAQTPTAPDEKRATQPKKRGGIFTMYVHDPLARTMCFSDGKEGLAFVNNDWGNRCSDLSYILAGSGSLVSGIEVNRVAAIVDLGTPDELRQRYGFEDAQGGGTGFASLHLNGDKIMILKQDLSKPGIPTAAGGVQTLYGGCTICHRANQVGPHLPRADCGQERQKFPAAR